MFKNIFTKFLNKKFPNLKTCKLVYELNDKIANIFIKLRYFGRFSNELRNL